MLFVWCLDCQNRSYDEALYGARDHTASGFEFNDEKVSSRAIEYLFFKAICSGEETSLSRGYHK